MITKEYKPSTQRTNILRERVVNGKPSICSERAVLYTESYKQTEGMPPAIRQAMAFDKFLTMMTINIQEGELIIGNTASRPLAASIFVEYGASWLKRELDTISTRESDPYFLSDEDKKKLEEPLNYWSGKAYEDVIQYYLSDECKKANSIVAIVSDHLKTGADGHLTPGYDLVLSKGLKGILRDAEIHLNSLDLSKPQDYEKLHFLQAVVMADKAVIKFAKRYADLARLKAAKETDAVRREELQKISEVFDWVPANPARTFWEALQVMALIMMTVQMESNGHSMNVGRIDQYLYPYYKKDIENRTLTKERALELLECCYLKLAEISKVIQEANAKFFRGYPTFSQITLGGQKRNGEDATNDLSYMMLDVTGNVRLSKPTVSARIHRNSPNEFLMKCLEINKVHKGGMPALYNDETAIRTLLGYGHNLTKEDVYDWDVVGCVELGVMGKGPTTASFFAFVNEPKILQMALFGGRDPRTKIALGPPQGGMTTWNSYEEMIDGLHEQMHLYNKLFTEELNVMLYVRRLRWTLPYLSSLIRDCVKRGLGHIEGGAISNQGGDTGAVGIANLGNSLAAIKKLVFEEKVITMAQLKHALETNFEDVTTNPTGPDIRQMSLAAPKYGNDDDYVDKIIKDITNWQADDIHQNISIFGTHNGSALLPVSAHIPFGEVVDATPDGRKAGKPLAEGCSPTQGSDGKGVTAAFKSVTKIDHVKHEGGTLYNVKIDPNSVENLSGMRKWADTVRTYFRLGGFHIQFNVTTADTLRAAQRSPEEYRDLLVRVAGYSAFFVCLDKALQEDIIARTEHRL